MADYGRGERQKECLDRARRLKAVGKFREAAAALHGFSWGDSPEGFEHWRGIHVALVERVGENG
jgi:hypothetical protein